MPLKHISRYRVGKMINKLHKEKMNEIRMALKEAEYVCTTADVWSGSSRRFLDVTAHWVILLINHN